MMSVGEKSLDQAQLDLEMSKAWGDDGREKCAGSSSEKAALVVRRKGVRLDPRSRYQRELTGI
jgi:hypothetical protein